MDYNKNRETIASIIATRRKELGLTLEEVGKIVGVGKSTVKKWETGFIANMRRDKIALLAKALNIDPSILIDASPDSYPDIYVPKLKKVPLLGITACGEPIYTQSFENGFTMIGEEFDVDFALQTKGDSMTGIGINDGDIVFFKESAMVDNGQIAAVFVDDETTLKRVYYYKDEQKLLLVAENPQYAPLLFQGEQLDHIRIIGLAVAHMRKL